jgi:hypothetical protein
MRHDPPRIDGLTAPAVLQKLYMVPTIEYVWHGRWDVWPVWRPKHHDREVGFNLEHYHIDGRFLTGAQWRFFDGKKFVKSGRPKEFHLAAAPLLYISPGYTGGYLPFPEPQYRRLRLLWEIVYPADYLLNNFPGGQTPIHQIAAAHKGKSLADPTGRQICPHKGAALAGVRRDADGGVTCPLHGLSFGPDHVCVGLRRAPKAGGEP